MDVDTADPAGMLLLSSCISAPTIFAATLGQQSRSHMGRHPVTARHSPDADASHLSVHNACPPASPPATPVAHSCSLASSSLSLKPSLAFSGLLSSLAV